MKNIIKGMLIGIANIIPGVSGGTFALILGIYDRLITALGNINFNLARNLFAPKKLLNDIKKADGIFLIKLAFGAVLSIGILSWGIDFLLKYHPGYTLSFFMGLIIPSISVPYKMIREKNWIKALFLIPGIVIVALIYSGNSINTNITLPVVFFSGVIAISAMILPGISGSFIMLVIGIYESVIGNIKEFLTTFSFDSFLFLAVFSMGCLLGLLFFVRIMKYFFKKYHDQTLFFLIGLVIGSLIVLWPFKDYPVDPLKIEIAVTTAKNIAPKGLIELSQHLVFLIIGTAGAVVMNCLAKENN